MVVVVYVWLLMRVAARSQSYDLRSPRVGRRMSR